MKWIKTRKFFLSEEAKIKDVVLPTQIQAIKSNWGEKWLDLEAIDPTENIKQGKWKLSDEDKIEVLGTFFNVKLQNIMDFFNSLPDKLSEVVNESIDLNLLKSDEKWVKILDNFDLKKPTINQISVLTDSIFRKISVTESMANEIIVRDENGRPIMDETTGRPQKRRREEGEIIFSTNLVNINTFLSDFNRIFPDSAVDASRFYSGDIQRLISASREDFGGDNYRVEVDLYARDMFLKIDHNPKDIFNMSISRFYSSCQHLYSGGYRSKVIGNVFDPNSIPAFIIFDTPIYNSEEELISEQLPLTRMMLRNIESFGEQSDKPKIFFDRAYPDRMHSILCKIVEKYSGNIRTDNVGSYLFTPDIPEDFIINNPYMDRLSLEEGIYIGVNANKIYINNSYDWSKVKISPKAKIKEIVIESPVLPKNFFSIPLNPDWMKIKFINIKSMLEFSNIKTESLAFDKCKLQGRSLVELNSINPEIKNLQLVSCQVKNLDFSTFNNLEELHLVYTIESNELQKIVENINLKKLVLSGDLVSENKKFINSLKQKGVKIEILGPTI